MTPYSLQEWVRYADRGASAVYHVGISAAHAGDVARLVLRLAEVGLVAPVQRRTGNRDKPFAYEVRRTCKPWAAHLVRL